MSKLKKLITCMLAVCAVGCISFGAAACDKSSSNYPDYINPSVSEEPDNPDEPEIPSDDPDAPYSGSYNISVKSAGGLPLSGVRIEAMQNGISVKEGISVDGVINFSLDQGEYEFKVVESSLPAGYYVPENQSYKNNPDLANLTVSIPSKIISSTAVSSTRYSVGDVMHDFSFTEVSDRTLHSLSEVFEGKKAVVLNFFYTSCPPCKAEFPALQSAYDNFSDDIAVIALADTGHDSVFDTVATFKKTMNLEFYVAQDQAAINTMFSVEAFPTTVIIDRYGVIAYKHSGSIVSTSVWNSTFAQFTSNDYVQSGTEEGDNDNDNVQELTKPNVEMSSPAAIANAINGEGTNQKVGVYSPETNEEDAEYSWPWIVKTETDGSCITASNVNVDTSYANIYTTITLEYGDILSYEYNVLTESGKDVLYVLIDREVVAEYSGDSEGWQTEYAVYIAQRDVTIELALSYLKDSGSQPENERASLRNINIVKASNAPYGVDIYTSAVSGVVDEDSGKYTDYANVVLSNADGYYHVGSADGPLLFADILNSTAWSDLHLGSKTFVNGSGTRSVASLYLYAYWNMSNWQAANRNPDEVELEFDFGHTDTILDNYYWQGFSSNGYVPVSESVKQMMIAFTKQYCTVNDKSDYAEQWLEFCYYGVHHGPKHIGDEECEFNNDPIKAFDFSNAYEVELDTYTLVDVDVILKWNNGGGKFYKFVPEETGIYYFHSIFTKNEEGNLIIDVDPLVIVYDSNKNVLGEFDDDLSYLMSTNDTPFNYYGYAYMVAGETYYFQNRCSTPGDLGKYEFKVEYTGLLEYDLLRVCSTGAGSWSYDEFGTYYLAIDVTLGSDNKYYEVTSNGSEGSKIYIDFVHPTYYDANGHTLKEIIDEGLFNLGGKDLTATMNTFYEQAISNEGELYGMCEASKELVDAICEYLNYYHAETKVSDYWLVFANYYQHFGA